ncbi:hypothetical protein [Flindersiella endophytica]
MTAIGLDPGATTVRDAEHVLHELLEGGLGGPRSELVACTHLIRDGNPHVALSLAAMGEVDVAALPGEFGLAGAGDRRGPATLADGAAAALAEQEARSGGRAVIYPGVETLTGSLPVWKLLAASAIEEVMVVGGPPCAPDTVVHTRDFVRPAWRLGKLVLATTPAADGGIAPFEIPNPGGCYCEHG